MQKTRGKALSKAMTVQRLRQVPDVWATVCKTVCPMLSDHCLSCPVYVCDVRALWPNGLTDQDETWHAGRPWPHCVRWGPSLPPPKGAEPSSPIFGQFLLCSNGWMHQDATWYGCRPQPGGLCVRWRPSPLPKKGAEPPLKFSALVYCGQTAGWIKMPLGTKVGLSPGDSMLHGGPAPPPHKGGVASSPIFGPFLLWPPCNNFII